MLLKKDLSTIKPNLIVMCGLQCSGKSTIAAALSNKFNAKVVSSDEIRKQHTDWKNDTIFKFLFQQINSYLQSGLNVILDATNTTIKMRKQIFSNIKYDCKKICYIINIPYHVCQARLFERNKQLDTHIVPMEVLDKYYKSFEIPFYNEGWDLIDFYRHVEADFGNSMKQLYLDLAKGYNQQNMHHTQDLGMHMQTVGDVIKQLTINKVLIEAAYFHDIGKLFTQTFKPNDPNAHYYNHANVGAYSALCVAGIFSTVCENNTVKDVIDINKTLEWLFYINYHMHLYNIKTEKAERKWHGIFGSENYNNLIILNKCDRGDHDNR